MESGGVLIFFPWKTEGGLIEDLRYVGQIMTIHTYSTSRSAPIAFRPFTLSSNAFFKRVKVFE